MVRITKSHNLKFLNPNIKQLINMATLVNSTETRLVCPNCGANFAIAEHTHLSVGMTIAKDSNLGTVAMPLAAEQDPSPQPRNKAEERLEALRKAGVNTANLFSMTGLDGVSRLTRMNGSALEEVSDDDEIFRGILFGKQIPNRRLFRRWVMAQMFSMLTRDGGFTAALNRKGAKYQWKMLVEELKVQATMFRHGDMECYHERNRWFNGKRVATICMDYIEALKADVGQRKTKNGKYVMRRVEVDPFDLERAVYEPLTSLANRIATTKDPMFLYRVVTAFYRQVERLWLNDSTPMSPAFKDAYKGSGAYFTLQNLIRFHNCNFPGLELDGSMRQLEDFATEYSEEGWRMLGVLKKFLRDNNIDIEAKMAEWRK